jgi:hypothetical protein
MTPAALSYCLQLDQESQLQAAAAAAEQRNGGRRGKAGAEAGRRELQGAASSDSKVAGWLVSQAQIGGTITIRITIQAASQGAQPMESGCGCAGSVRLSTGECTTAVPAMPCMSCAHHTDHQGQHQHVGKKRRDEQGHKLELGSRIS